MKAKLALFLTLLLVFLCALPAMAADDPVLKADQAKLIVAAGKTSKISLTVTPYAYRKAGVYYESSDESIATVNRSGQVKGVALGECVITITSKKDENLVCTLPVQVVTPVKKITAEAAQSTIHIGESTAITCSYLPEDATIQDVTFESSKENVAVVNAQGVVTGIARGQATITAYSADGYAKTSLRINVHQQPEEITLAKEEVDLVVGKSTTLKATVLPKTTNDKSVTWSSSDESLATVSQKGVVKALAPGDVTITAACTDEPSVTASCVVHCQRRADSVSFDEKEYEVIIGQTLQLSPTVLPEDTTDKSVTYAPKNKKIVSVDETGLLTALKGGETSVTVTTADGSKRKTTITVRVIVPVTGVGFEHDAFRVGAGSYTYVSAVFEPSDASNQNATWVSSDDSIASIRGSGKKVRVNGNRWGRCTLTCTTEEGGYSASIDVNVGSLSRAVTVDDISIRDGKPYITLYNRSNMYITCVTYDITGTDAYGNPISLSSRDDTTLHGSYNLTLAPGQYTEHGRFDFHHYISHEDLEQVSIAVTGWETDTGYYDNHGNLCYSYKLSSGSQVWETYETDFYVEMQRELAATPTPQPVQ